MVFRRANQFLGAQKSQLLAPLTTSTGGHDATNSTSRSSDALKDQAGKTKDGHRHGWAEQHELFIMLGMFLEVIRRLYGCRLRRPPINDLASPQPRFLFAASGKRAALRPCSSW